MSSKEFLGIRKERIVQSSVTPFACLMRSIIIFDLTWSNFKSRAIPADAMKSAELHGLHSSRLLCNGDAWATFRLHGCQNIAEMGIPLLQHAGWAAIRVCGRVSWPTACWQGRYTSIRLTCFLAYTTCWQGGYTSII